MLVKEYRIPLPLSVDEYKIAQLYMIAKKSKDESKGTGSGVEILKNEPYSEGPGGSGQYTYKIYHVGHHLPAWLKALLPKSALTVEEMAWNAYPYTKTRYTCPFIEKFSIEIETRYFNDCGNQQNVFDLNSSEIGRQIDFIDIIKEQVFDQDIDPKVYHSEKTNRGPLSDDWVAEFWNNGKPQKAIMCAYKLCRVEFKYWGMQSKIEKFIHDSALRKTMVTAHQQAWAWQDEWVDLTMADIRRLELETQEFLRQRMTDENAPNENENNLNLIGKSPNEEPGHTNASNILQTVDFNMIDKDKDIDELHFDVPQAKKNSLSQYSLAPSHNSLVSKDGSNEQFKQKHWSRSNSRTTLHSPADCLDVLSAWRMQSLVPESDSSSDEFYDAEDMNEQHSPCCLSKIDRENDSEDNIFSAKYLQQLQLDLISQTKPLDEFSLCDSTNNSPNHQAPCAISTLIIILHGGSVLDVASDVQSNKMMDITTFKNSMDTVMNQYYKHLIGRIALRYVSCPSICMESLMVLSSLSPHNVQSPTDGISQSFSSIPIGALPLFAVSSHDYRDNISNVISQCNKVYSDFLKSDEGKGFTGKVAFIGDSVGAILGFDALCHVSSQGNVFGSDASIQDIPDLNKSNHSNPIISITDSLTSIKSDTSTVSSEEHSMNALAKSKTLPISTNLKNVQQPKQQLYCKSLSHPGNDCVHSDYSNRLLISNAIRRRSSSSSDQMNKLEFEVNDFFMFGSLLGIVLTFRKMLSMDDKSFTLSKPACSNLYNLIHPSDPSALRIEPLISARFSKIPPVNVPRFQKFPCGDGQPIHLLEYLQIHKELFLNDTSSMPMFNKTHNRRTSDISVTSNNSPIDNLNLPNINLLMQRWWGLKRIDYALYCPEGLSNFPTHSLPHIFHSSYWESSDVISFILRQLNKWNAHHATSSGANDVREICFKPNQPREKWQRKRTSVKLKNVTANHRANDVIVKEGVDVVITGRFMYGPLDVVALTGEKIDIHMRSSTTGEWDYVATEMTDKTGRLVYTVPKDKVLSCGLYQFKMVVRGDHTFLELFVAVVPAKTEAVVFSIDGSLTASVSVSGRDPKVRPGSVDVVRFWQELGYLIIYITGRPDIQQQRVVSWLSQHNFPHGLIFFADGISTDPLRHKAEYLKNLNQKMDINFRAAYGSSKDISVYQSLDMKPDQIYIAGKVSKKQQTLANVLENGYVAHLEELKANGSSRPAQGNARIVLPRGAFSGLRSKHSQKLAKRTISFPTSGNGNGSTGNTTNTTNMHVIFDQ
ncbi:hypothetical protein RDWZM_007478 [Blomia tropicalis]|uniref:DDHD domain-containing protein n=1 Tax=Blomia tropicalis TaxID=40697 RepID=A0A9Q0RJ55_BLOTA|nr:hypothetical protein RDWZM_007478 [Blomia tropicalis]